MKIYDDLKEARRHYNPKKKYYKELIAIPSSNTGGTSWNTDCYIEVTEYISNFNNAVPYILNCTGEIIEATEKELIKYKMAKELQK